MTAATALSLGRHEERLNSLDKRIDGQQVSLNSIDAKLDSLKNLIIGALVAAAAGLAGTIAELALRK